MHLPFPSGHVGEAGQLGHVYQLDGKTLMSKEDMPSYRAVQGEEFDDYSYWVGQDPRTRRAFSTSARQVRGPAGEKLGAALAYQDITELMRAMQVKDEFVSSVSHELRTPLTSLLGYLEILCEHDDLPDDVISQLQVMQRNALRLRTLLSDLLHVGEADEGGLQVERAPMDLVDVVREAVEASRPVADKCDMTLELETPDHLCVVADEQRIRQVVDNLISNAIKYTGAGGSVSVVLRGDAGRHRARGQRHRDGHPARRGREHLRSVLPGERRANEPHPGHRARAQHRQLHRGCPRRRRHGGERGRDGAAPSGSPCPRPRCRHRSSDIERRTSLAPAEV